MTEQTIRSGQTEIPAVFKLAGYGAADVEFQIDDVVNPNFVQVDVTGTDASALINQRQLYDLAAWASNAATYLRNGPPKVEP